MTEPSDAQLLERARQGDEAALRALLEKHQRRVYRFSMQMCRHPDDAQDVLQDTLLAMARSVRDFRGASSVSTWLYTIARNFCAKRRRQPNPSELELLEAGGVQSEALADPGGGPDEQLANLEVGAALQRAIADLEPKYREVLVLRDIEGLKAAEVAKILDINVPAVKSRLHRARLAMRDALEPLLAPQFETQPSTPTAGTAEGSGQRAERCPDVLMAFSQNLEGELSPATCARMETHIAECAKCRGACDSLKQVLSLCQSAPEPELSPELQQAVRQTLDACLRSEATEP